jgi:hypothetical protein
VISDDPIRDLERQLVGAVPRTAGAPRQASRWRWALPAGAACVAVVAGLILWIGGDASAPSMAQAAYARLNPGGGIIELKYDSRFYDGGRLYQHARTEVWYSAGHEHTVATSIGPRSGRDRRFLEVVRTARQIRSYESGAGTITVQANCRVPHTTTGDPIAYFESLYRSHRISQRGTATFDGRRVSRLVAADAGQQFVFFVTAESGEPVAMTVRPLALIARGARFTGTVVRFLSYRRLPIDASSRAQLDMAPHSEARLIELGRSRCPQR